MGVMTTLADMAISAIKNNPDLVLCKVLPAVVGMIILPSWITIPYATYEFYRRIK